MMWEFLLIRSSCNQRKHTGFFSDSKPHLYTNSNWFLLHLLLFFTHNMFSVLKCYFPDSFETCSISFPWDFDWHVQPLRSQSQAWLILPREEVCWFLFFWKIFFFITTASTAVFCTQEPLSYLSNFIRMKDEIILGVVSFNLPPSPIALSRLSSSMCLRCVPFVLFTTRLKGILQAF